MKQRILIRTLVSLLLAALLTGCVEKKEANLPGKLEAVAPAAAKESSAPATTPEPTREPAATPKLKLFPWREKTFAVKGATDDASLIDSVEAPEGKYVRVDLFCMDGEATTADTSQGFRDFSLRDESGADYSMQSILYEIDAGHIAGGNISPIFDVPADVPLNALTFRIPTDTAGETIIIRLADVPVLTP